MQRETYMYIGAAGYLSRAWRKGREYRSASDLPRTTLAADATLILTVVATNLQFSGPAPLN